MDAQVLARSEDRCNKQYAEKTSRRTGRSVAALSKTIRQDLGLHDGRRITVGPDEARVIATNCAFLNPRAIDKGNFRSHSLDMQRGRFWPGSQIVFAQLPDGTLVLVDGSHRLHAVIDADEMVEFQVRIERVLNYDSVRDLYCSIDTNIRKRSDADIIRAGGVADKLDVQRTTLTAALGAVTAIACGLQILPSCERPAEVITAYGRKDAVVEWIDEIRIYDGILNAGYSETMRARLRTQGMMAPALVTLRYQLQKAKRFWLGVAENNGLTKGDPRRALVTTLTESTHRGKQNAGLVYAAAAWNAWFEVRSLNHLRAYDTSRCRLLGTPFAAKGRTDADDEPKS